MTLPLCKHASICTPSHTQTHAYINIHTHEWIHTSINIHTYIHTCSDYRCRIIISKKQIIEEDNNNSLGFSIAQLILRTSRADTIIIALYRWSNNCSFYSPSHICEWQGWEPSPGLLTQGLCPALKSDPGVGLVKSCPPSCLWCLGQISASSLPPSASPSIRRGCQLHMVAAVIEAAFSSQLHQHGVGGSHITPVVSLVKL